MENKIRQLAAIMFTDMVGYTALMQVDEKKARANRERQRVVLDTHIKKHYGLILQTFGDGTLSVFGSAIEAIEAAIEIQQELQSEPKVDIRMGLHVGDIVYDDEGIYGDGVNVASRIESIAVAGSVLISGKLFDEIKNHPTLPAKFMGDFKFKNVSRPVSVFALASKTLTVPDASQLQGRIESQQYSVAVLPFVNMSSDPDNAFFSDGISEEIINALTHIDGLKVTARTSSFAFKGKDYDIPTIGKMLNVHHVLEGSVRKVGNKARITAQLIKVSDGYHIMSEVYERDLEDIFAVQDEISRKIAHTLRVKLITGEESDALVVQKTENIEAYNLYLKGIASSSRWEPKSLKESIIHFEEAIELDPDFASAHAELAFAYGFLSATGQMQPEKGFPIAEKYAQRSLKLDYQNADSHAAMAVNHFFYKNNLKKAGQSFNLSLAINPGSGKVRSLYSFYLRVCGKPEEAHEQIKLAAESDPLFHPTQISLANSYALNNQFSTAHAIIDAVLDTDPEFRMAIEAKAWIYVLQKKMDLAISYFKKYKSFVPHPLKGLTGLGYAYGKSGQNELAEKIVEKMKLRMQQEPDTAIDVDIAVVYVALNRMDEAFKHIEIAFEKKLGVIFLFSHPLWDNVRKDERFKKLIKAKGYDNIKDRNS